MDNLTSTGFPDDLDDTTSIIEIAWFSESVDILFGTLLGFMTIFGIGINFSVFAMFAKHRKELSSRTTWLMMSLAASDGIMALIGGSMFTISSFNHKWPFGDTACVFYAFVMYATGCADIGHLMIIAVDRMLAISSPIKYRSAANKTHLHVLAVTLSWLFGVFWAFLPLVGLQRYTYEGKTSCSIDWLSTKPTDIAYNFMMFIGSYFIPLAVMLFSYGLIFLTVKGAGKKFAGDDAAAAKKREIEIKLAKNFSMVIIVYMTFWTPYAVVSMWGSYGDPSVIPSAARGFPALLSKFSFVVNPLLYVLSNKEHRKRLRGLYGIKESAVAPAPAPTPTPAPVKLAVADNEMTGATEC